MTRAQDSTTFFLTAIVACTQWASAGTTGGISGVVNETGTTTPIAGATVTVTSPSQSASTTTDARGHFAFVSLAPDEYTVALQKTGYEPLSYAGVAVLRRCAADADFEHARGAADDCERYVAQCCEFGKAWDDRGYLFHQRGAASAHGRTWRRRRHSIAPIRRSRPSPARTSQANQNGYNQAVHIRGGDASEVGYEFDGIPVNRAFDNYPSSSVSSLGQLELQVYTGATPANAEAQGLAGFINQVIKTGTFPGYAAANLSAGTPLFDHSAQRRSRRRDARPHVFVLRRNRRIQSGLSLCRSVRRSGVCQRIPASSSVSVRPLRICPAAGCRHVIPTARRRRDQRFPGLDPRSNRLRHGRCREHRDAHGDHDFHIAIPHKNDSLRDDVQLLYDNDEIFTTFFSSVNDEGYSNWINTVGSYPPYYLDAWQYKGPIGTFLPTNYASQVRPYFYPSSPAHPFDGPIPDPNNQRDRGYNGQAIFKLQYQKNFSSNAFLRVYGYSYYSDWIENGPMMSLQPYAYYDSGDYEINNHTRGVSLNFTDQLSPQDLLEAEGSYTTSTGARIYNEQMFQYSTAYGNAFAVLVNRNNPLSGTCYHLYGGGTPYTAPTTCSDGQASGVTYGSLPTFLVLSNPTGTLQHQRRSCGGGPCAYYPRGERRIRTEQHRYPVLHRLLDHRSMAAERQALFQPRPARR